MIDPLIICNSLQNQVAYQTTITITMFISRATICAFLLLSSKSGRFVYGDLPTTIKSKALKGQEKNVLHSPHHRHLSKKGADDSIQVDIEGDIAVLQSTDWPTYSPSEMKTQIPTPTNDIESPTIIIIDSLPTPISDPTPSIIDEISVPTLNCNPIGSRDHIIVDKATRNIPVTSSPVTSDTLEPTEQTADAPSDQATSKPTTQDVTFRRGDLLKDVERFGISVSKGIIVRMLAKADRKVPKSDLKFHSMPDGATIIPLDDGYVYVSNSEVDDGKGGVYGVYFNHDGDIVDYKQLLSGTTRNCSGGKCTFFFPSISSLLPLLLLTNICINFLTLSRHNTMADLD